MNNFQKICEFHRTFGLPVSDLPQEGVLYTNIDLVNFRLALIKEEVGETREALKSKDLVEIVDGLADTLYVAYGMAASFGIDIDRIIRARFENEYDGLTIFNFITESAHLSIHEVVPPVYELLSGKMMEMHELNIRNIENCYDRLVWVCIEEKDFWKIPHLLANLIIETYYMGGFLGIDMDRAYSLVHESNMTKACENEEQAMATVEKYKREFLEEGDHSRYEFPDYRLSEDGKYYIVFNNDSGGKILKNKDYRAVDLRKLCGLVN